MSAQTVSIQDINDDNSLSTLFPLMRQLRPQLANAEDFVDRVHRQASEGYRVMALYDEGKVQALAGYRVQENLVHGRFLYLDDLVTDAQARGLGYGEQLIERLRDRASELGCGRLVLDTPMSNALGHRFYFRCGLLASSLRFLTDVG